jgi:hypothetical protein
MRKKRKMMLNKLIAKPENLQSVTPNILINNKYEEPPFGIMEYSV